MHTFNWDSVHRFHLPNAPKLQVDVIDGFQNQSVDGFAEERLHNDVIH